LLYWSGMKALIGFLLIALMLLLAGCKNLESQLVGTWTGPGNQNLDLKADKSFSLGSGNFALAGKWDVKDNKTVHLDVATVGGKPKEQALDDLMKMAAAMVPKEKLAEEKKKAQDQLNNMNLAYDADKKSLTLAGPTGQTAVFTKAGS
jgi:hypothetical protein